MKPTLIRSERQRVRFARADMVCRELRHLLAKDGMVHGNNSDRLMRHFFSWMRVAGRDKYSRP